MQKMVIGIKKQHSLSINEMCLFKRNFSSTDIQVSGLGTLVGLLDQSTYICLRQEETCTVYAPTLIMQSANAWLQ